jgi:hypothetical protein
MADWLGSYAKFRLNFEQQGERAKELLKAARAGEPEALARFKSPPKLAEARYLIAKELRFENWAALKRHIAAMTLEREAMSASALDSDLRTLHVRCGDGLTKSLQEAGFRGDIYVDRYPYLIGPVREGPDCLRQRAHFIVDTYKDDHDWLEYEGQAQAMEDHERELHDSADYERVVLWFEHDRDDQLTQLRILGHYAIHRRPPRLELINIGDFPGARRFTGLGELPPEALRMLWPTRKPVSSAQLQLGLNAWRALANPDPRPLAAIMRSDTPALPLLAPALHRHLRELPSSVNGLSLTEEMALTLLAEEPHNVHDVIFKIIFRRDPLPGEADGNVLRRVLGMEAATARVYTRSPGPGPKGEPYPPWSDALAITGLGRAVLRGEVDFRSLNPAARWVGGVHIQPGVASWRWDEVKCDAVLRES